MRPWSRMPGAALPRPMPSSCCAMCDAGSMMRCSRSSIELKKNGIAAFLALNKIDLVKAEALLELAGAFNEAFASARRS